MNRIVIVILSLAVLSMHVNAGGFPIGGYGLGLGIGGGLGLGYGLGGGFGLGGGLGYGLGGFGGLGYGLGGFGGLGYGLSGYGYGRFPGFWGRYY